MFRRCLVVTLALIPLRAAVRPGALPIAFEPNRGQAASDVRFLSHAREGALLLKPHEAVLRLADRSELTIRPQGGNFRPELVAEDAVAGVSHYLLGNDRSRWVTDVPHFRRVRYRGVYPGIDLLFYGGEGALEYDLIVAPGADPSAIRLRLGGTRRLSLNRSGNLEISIGSGRIEERLPAVYQEVGGNRRRVAGRFAIAGNQVGFVVGRYDRTHPLVIDPAFRYGTYLGGASTDVAAGIAVDASGSAYVVGSTVSADFPVTSNALQVKHGGTPNTGINFIGVGNVFDVFVSKFSPDGSSLVYSTFLGGTGTDTGYAIAVDGAGNAVVTGSTTSPNFPLAKGAIQTALPADGSAAGFITKLNATGSNILYSTYLGAAGGATIVAGLALDAAGSPYVTGWTYSQGYPVSPGALQPKLAGSSDGFVTKLNPQGTAVVYSTYLGGRSSDTPSAIAVDSASSAYVTGITYSTDFPVTSPAAQTAAGGQGDAFISKLNASGTALMYSTYFGGSATDSGSAIALDSDHSALIAGATYSSNFPTSLGAFQAAVSDTYQHAFVLRLDPGGAVQYATLLRGSGSDSGTAIAVAADGSALVGGYTTSADFPLTSDAYQRSTSGFNCFTIVTPFPFPPAQAPCTDAFLTIVHVSGRRLIYSTFLGGTDNDSAAGLALGTDGSIYMTGNTGANDFPTTQGAFSRSRKGGICTDWSSPTAQTEFACQDAFVVKVDPNAVGPPRPLAAVINGANGVGGAVAPGEFVSLYGLAIGPQTPDTARLGPDGEVATTLSGATVTFDGVPAPLLYVGPNQINAIVPFAAAGKQATTLAITTPAYSANVATAAVAPTAPALFSNSGGGAGQVIALNQDGTVNGPTNPAPRGSVIVLYATGLGQTTPSGVDGRLAPLNPLSLIAAPVRVLFNGTDGHVQYAGAAPGLVEGVAQINVAVPSGVAPGSQVLVVVAAGGLFSQNGAWVAVE